MHHTRVLRAVASNNNGKFLIAPDSFWDVATSAIQGAWAQLTDSAANQNYERAVTDGVIKDHVLSQARHGSMLTMALFHNLQTPLFEKHRFDVKEFLGAVGPALEKYHDTLASLIEDMNLKRDDPYLKTFEFSVSEKENMWRSVAEFNPNSKAAQLAKMASDNLLDDQYFGARLFQALTGGTSQSMMHYVPGSCEVKEVALLSARAVEMDYRQSKIEQKEDAELTENKPKDSVAVRMEVLYEISKTYQDQVPPSPMTIAAQTSPAALKKYIHNQLAESQELLATVVRERLEREKQQKLKKTLPLQNEELYGKRAIQRDNKLTSSSGEAEINTASSAVSEKDVMNDKEKTPLTQQKDAAKVDATIAVQDKAATKKEAPTSLSTSMNTVEALATSVTLEKTKTNVEVDAVPEENPEITAENDAPAVVPDATNDVKVNASTEAHRETKTKSEAKTITESALAVAVFEGWLHGGPDKELRWKVAMVRDALEFT